MLDIDPGTEANPAVAEWESVGLRAPDMQAVRSWRLQRLRNQLEAEDMAGIVLFDPLNIRYALDATNMQVWCTHNAVRYAFVATDRPVILFDLARCEHLTAHLPLIDEVRPATGWFFFENGPRESEAADLWADEIADLVRLHGRGSLRIALDKCEGLGLAALERRGLEAVGTMRFALSRWRRRPCRESVVYSPATIRSGGRTGALGSSRPVASRSALRMAGVEDRLGGSPTPLSP